jgi:hypothetical protein
MRTTLLSSLALLGAFSLLATTPHASAASQALNAVRIQSLATYFPATAQYPAGYKLLPAHQSSRAAQLFSGANATLAARYHFVTGAMQTALGPRDTVVALTIARFRDPAGAQHFRAAVRSDVVDDGAQKTGVLHGLGSGVARYESGNCASCGPGSPLLDQVFFARGPVFIEISTQPANQGLARHLGAMIDAKLKRAHVH